MFEIRSHKTVYLTHNGQRFRVHPINQFPSSVLVEPNSGIFFNRYWKVRTKRDEELKRSFRQYADIYSLFRGLWQAIQSTKLARIPSQEELQAEIRDINFEINSCRVIDEAEIDKARLVLAKVLKQLKYVQTYELREAREQISCAIVFRDRLGRLNTGVVCARLVASRNRFSERIENIISWLQYYVQWADALAIFLTFHRRFLPRLETRLEQIIGEAADVSKGRMVIGRIRSIYEEISRRQFFGGWQKWARQCQTDLAAAISSVCQQENEEAVTLLKKIRQAVKLKLIQYRIHELLLAIDLDIINKTSRMGHYQKMAREIIADLNLVDEVGFRAPVKEEVGNFLKMAVFKPEIIKDFKTFCGEGKELLRQAYQML